MTVVRGDSSAHCADHHELLEDRDVVGPIDDRLGTPGRNFRYSSGPLRFLDIMGMVLACT